MKLRQGAWRAAVLAGAAALAGYGLRAQVEPKGAVINAPYVTTPADVVDGMLTLAGVGPRDTVYDLGCGDGRIVIAAARKYGAHGVGIDLNPRRVAEARANARRAGVERLVTFREQDVFDTDLRAATVVTLYLLPDLNLALRPKLLGELRPGARVISHAFPLGDWKPERELRLRESRIFRWTVPEH